MSDRPAVLDAPTGDDTRIYDDHGKGPRWSGFSLDERRFYTGFCPTGSDTRVWRRITSSATDQRLVHEIIFGAVGPGSTAVPIYLTSGVGGEAVDDLLIYFFIGRLHARVLRAPVVRSVRRQRTATSGQAPPTPAARLRELAGLGAERLASIFGVSRTTYNNWIREGTPQGSHGEQLLEVVSLVEDVAARLGTPKATREWLLTPISAGGKKPIDLLAERQYPTFRGYLLRVPTGREIGRRLPATGRSPAPLAEEAVREQLELLRPRQWKEDQPVERGPAPSSDTPADTVGK